MSKDLKKEDKFSLDLIKGIKGDLKNIKKEKEIMKKMQRVLLLCDISGSMGEVVGDKPKIQHLREAVLKFSLRKFVFSNSCYEVSEIPGTKSNTNLTDALKRVRVENPSKIILISDGLPDYPDTAIKVAKTLSFPIDIIYIGNDETGKEFMQMLAKVTGGTEVTLNPENYQMNDNNLSNAIRNNVALALEFKNKEE